MDNELEQVKQSIKEIQDRNKRVELDKAWETSNARKVSIAIMTYMVMTILMWSLGTDKPYINAIIPTLGFVLSTFSLPFFKSLWIKRSNTHK
jgi:hypothetical protein